ncbi:MAG: tRNA pseudouridine(55) synthase [Desulfobulbus propionicus]|nr:MAG: tRNA pseudouridine(55) synthase [Desulfobulbus propionicus]
MSQEQGTGSVVLLDKPTGISSFAMVREIRRHLGIKKVGHAGTLDPFASGLLIVCVGRPATRNIERFMAARKTYTATLKLGVETLTHDPEGEIVSRKRVALVKDAEEEAEEEAEDKEIDVVICQEQIMATLSSFLGKQMQTPPAFSAAKHKGKPLYYYARKGILIEKKPKEVEIYSLACLRLAREEIDIEVCCSRGTYIRVLAADIGRKLGCGASLTALRRTASGPFSVEQGLHGAALQQKDARECIYTVMMPVEEALARLEQKK